MNYVISILFIINRLIKNQHLLPHQYFLIVVVCPVCARLLTMQQSLLKIFNFTMCNRHFMSITVILAVVALISRPIMIRSSQLFYLPNQVFLRRPPALWNQHLACYILIYLLRPLTFRVINFLILMIWYAFFNEAWDHLSRDLMIHIVEKNLF